MRSQRLLMGGALLVCSLAWWLWPAGPADPMPRALQVSERPLLRGSFHPRPAFVPPKRVEEEEAVAAEASDRWGRLVGWVGGEEGVPRGALVFVRGEAAIRALSVPLDGYFELELAPGRYTIHAVGPHSGVSEPEQVVEVEVAGDTEVEVQLSIDGREDPGLVLLEVDEGLEITAVLEGGPADRLGLLPGDRVLAVDGVPASDLDAAWLTERLELGEVESLEVWLEDEEGGGSELMRWDVRS